MTSNIRSISVSLEKEPHSKKPNFSGKKRHFSNRHAVRVVGRTDSEILSERLVPSISFFNFFFFVHPNKYDTYTHTKRKHVCDTKTILNCRWSCAPSCAGGWTWKFHNFQIIFFRKMDTVDSRQTIHVSCHIDSYLFVYNIHHWHRTSKGNCQFTTETCR